VIVRILGEGQRELPDGEQDALDDLDADLQRAVDAGDEVAVQQALAALHDRVRSAGTPLPADRLVPSDLVLPSSDAGLAEVRDLLEAEGLTQGMDR
jgi:hypothetical protein